MCIDEFLSAASGKASEILATFLILPWFSHSFEHEFFRVIFLHPAEGAAYLGDPQDRPENEGAENQHKPQNREC